MAVQKTIKVIDVNKTAPVETKDVKVGTNSTVKTTNDSNPGNSASMGVTLPTGLKQLEMFVTTEDKDIYAYEYFSRVSILLS